MSLIVARKFDDQIVIVSDTKLSYPEELYPNLSKAAPDEGVIKTIILNPHLCISYSCDDISVAEDAIKQCRKLDSLNAILQYLVSLNVSSNDAIQFIVCVCLYAIRRIYEIKNKKLHQDINNSWIGSNNGYNIFQESMFDHKNRVNRSEFNSSDMESAIEDVIRGGKDESVSGFRITVDCAASGFTYKSFISSNLPSRTYHFKGPGSQSIVIGHGTAEEGGYNVHVFHSEKRYDIVAIHILQGKFGIIYHLINDGLLWPKVYSGMDEIEFSEFTREKFGIGPFGYTMSAQKSYFERGNKAYAEKEFAKAIAFYDRGLKETEKFYLAHLNYNKGLVLHLMNRRNEALVCFYAAVQIDKSFEDRVKAIVFKKN